MAAGKWLRDRDVVEHNFQLEGKQGERKDHYYITRDGKVHECRPVERMGAHARGANANSIGICYEGGLDANGCIADTRTAAQKDAMFWLIINLHHRFPDIKVILGHRDLPGVQKACPCFDATKLQPLLEV